jgi:ankyrin repeat protein
MNNTILKLLADGNVASAVAEINKNPDLLHETDENGVILAHRMASAGTIAHVSNLVTQAVLELVAPPHGWTTLHYAAAAGQTKALAEPLKKYGARVMHWKDDRGEIPAHVAARHGNLDGFPSEMLTPFHLSNTNNFGQTPLHVAAENKHLDQISVKYDPILLLGRDAAGRTVLQIAQETGAVDQLPGQVVILARSLATQFATAAQRHGGN